MNQLKEHQAFSFRLVVSAISQETGQKETRKEITVGVLPGPDDITVTVQSVPLIRLLEEKAESIAPNRKEDFAFPVSAYGLQEPKQYITRILI